MNIPLLRNSFFNGPCRFYEHLVPNGTKTIQILTAQIFFDTQSTIGTP